MADQDNAKIIEPLAKFHAKVYVKGRVRIISNERDFLGLSDGDIVKLIIRTLDENKRPVHRAYFEGMLVSGGNVTIPKELINKLGIKKGDVVEILLIGYQKLHEIIPEEHYLLLRQYSSGKFKLISADEEKHLLENITLNLY
ncbi:AbrB/MazE/SpoVT family DNA-binding domain-containing protein [Thermococcus sp. GR7]|uniref:AbrB/MazE/SpoVT family DNA-binding domain-containing protein n=1 Tax=unclassified Thermococcus TaxID=2627626 RepID=UPI00142F89E8|nr:MULTISPECIES: AbrB/MazE/SpoVT family DNA-binding domain-containing protein [unclassified Thermococcus]NJE47344.1 AbrB/MazE/SpoVT family DNA-binding domain-containing protein [Thermococcus sp. GR7]NJE79455.1 AbrB/MazE/SpoVT family DNA-binding domain-containing protein [Thermococcus sp. GR4]NJF23166.1 AbrB/MazE/SpoVT family DNA-binding domain-containing protein [Thermococcus sp. GR5]